MEKELSDEDGRLLLKIAREKILREFGYENEDLSQLCRQLDDWMLTEDRGVFVTLHRKSGDLRGCIGNIEPVKPLIEGVQDNACHAAFHDSRFTPLSYEELEDTVIEISILTRPEKIEYADADELLEKIRPGIDGIILGEGHNRATFLPQVWEQLTEPSKFLGHLCMKAGLRADEWLSGTLEISCYQVDSFEE